MLIINPDLFSHYFYPQNIERDDRMKQVVSVLLIILLGTQCLIQLGIVASYHFDKEYIVKSFCENRGRPQLHCEGKCFLKKRLAEVEKKERQASGIEKQLEIPLFLIVVDEYSAVESFDLMERNIPLVRDYTHIIDVSIFHPPSGSFA